MEIGVGIARKGLARARPTSSTPAARTTSSPSRAPGDHDIRELTWHARRNQPLPRRQSESRAPTPRPRPPSSTTASSRRTRRALRARLLHAIPAPHRHDPQRAVHRQARQHGDAGAVQALSDTAGAGERERRGARGDDQVDRLLPEQVEEPDRHGDGRRRARMAARFPTRWTRS